MFFCFYFWFIEVFGKKGLGSWYFNCIISGCDFIKYSVLLWKYGLVCSRIKELEIIK